MCESAQVAPGIILERFIKNFGGFLARGVCPQAGRGFFRETPFRILPQPPNTQSWPPRAPSTPPPESLSTIHKKIAPQQMSSWDIPPPDSGRGESSLTFVPGTKEGEGANFQ